MSADNKTFGKEQKQFWSLNNKTIEHRKTDNNDNKVPVEKGCFGAKYGGGCFCDGSCKEIVGYRDKLPGEV